MDGGPIPSDTNDGAPLVEGFSDLKVLGHGGSATVYSATDVVLHRRVALKIIASNHSDHRRFQRECRILATLSEVDGVVPVLAAAVASDGRPVIVMKLLDGGSLTSVVRTSGPLAIGDTLRVGDRLCGALGAAHSRGIFHRDIKPDNVLFTLSGAPALGDFGIATIDAVANSSETLGSLSPPHAPPERFLGEEHSNAAAGDVYSLGSTLYYCLAGAPPFGTAAQGGLTGLLKRVADDPVPQIERDDLPTGMQQVLETAMQKTPADRFESIEQFAAALRSIGAVRGSGRSGHIGLITVTAVPTSPPSFADEVKEPLADGHPALASPADQDRTGVALASVSGDSPSSAVPDSPASGGHADPPVEFLPPRRRRTSRARGLALLAVGALVAVVLGAIWLRGTEEGVAAGGSGAEPTTTTSSTTTSTIAPETADVATPTAEVVAEATPRAAGGVDSPLTSCTFNGSADLVPGVAPESSGPQTLDLRRGSIIRCTQASGGEWSGSLDFHADFADLAFTSGSGAGTCLMAWEDGSETRCTAEVVLLFPEITFNVVLTEGPFAGQTGTALLAGWEPSVASDGVTIVRLAFKPTTLVFG